MTCEGKGKGKGKGKKLRSWKAKERKYRKYFVLPKNVETNEL